MTHRNWDALMFGLTWGLFVAFAYFAARSSGTLALAYAVIALTNLIESYRWGKLAFG